MQKDNNEFERDDNGLGFFIGLRNVCIVYIIIAIIVYIWRK